MNKHERFKVRIFDGEFVYLKVEDCANALDLSLEDFKEKYSDLIKEIDVFGAMVTEKDYNKLLQNNKDAFAKQMHLEMTKANILRANTNFSIDMYPIKMAFLGRKCGTDVNIYQEARKDLLANKEREEWHFNANNISQTEEYESILRILSNKLIFDKTILEKYNLELQFLTVINVDGEINLHTFIVGEHWFCELFLDSNDETIYYFDDEDNCYDADEYVEGLNGPYLCCRYHLKELTITADGELIIPYNSKDDGEWPDYNYGKCSFPRDFRRHSVIENILWALDNTSPMLEGEKLYYYGKDGIFYMLSKNELLSIFVPKIDDATWFFEGILDYEKITYSTVVETSKIFSD